MKKIIGILTLVLLVNINIMGEQKSEVAILGGGCFWCLDAVYQKVKGVERIESGFSGGFIKNPAYREVTSGRTGHAEVVKITFDPEVIPYKVLLSIFFAIHDPTSLNKQGADVGTHYRSVIFYSNEEQKKVAEELMKQLKSEGVYNKDIVTQLVESAPFYKAEESHQDYYSRNTQQPYCQIVINPKINKFRDNFKEWMIE